MANDKGTAVIPNKYAAACLICKGDVQAGEGFAIKEPAKQRWFVLCASCLKAQGVKGA